MYEILLLRSAPRLFICLSSWLAFAFYLPADGLSYLACGLKSRRPRHWKALDWDSRQQPWRGAAEVSVFSPHSLVRKATAEEKDVEPFNKGLKT